MKTIARLTVLAFVCLLGTATAGTTERNPFAAQLKKIADMEKKIEATKSEKLKESYTKRLELEKKRLDDTVSRRKQPYTTKLERYQKDLEKAKSKSQKAKINKKIKAVEDTLAQIDAWANPAPVEEKKEEKKEVKK